MRITCTRAHVPRRSQHCATNSSRTARIAQVYKQLCSVSLIATTYHHEAQVFLQLGARCKHPVTVRDGAVVPNTSRRRFPARRTPPRRRRQSPRPRRPNRQKRRSHTGDTTPKMIFPISPPTSAASRSTHTQNASCAWHVVSSCKTSSRPTMAWKTPTPVWTLVP